MVKNRHVEERHVEDRRDQAQLDYLQQKAAEYRTKAEQTTDPRESRQLLKAARRYEQQYRTQAAFPIELWLWAVRIVVPMLTWSIIGRRHPVLGAVAGMLVLVVLVGFEIRKRRSSTSRQDPALPER